MINFFDERFFERFHYLRSYHTFKASKTNFLRCINLILFGAVQANS
jgi:hypothetical protein